MSNSHLKFFLKKKRQKEKKEITWPAERTQHEDDCYIMIYDGINSNFHIFDFKSSSDCLDN